MGYGVGRRLLEALCYRERGQRRETRLLDMLKFVHSTLWRYMFGRQARVGGGGREGGCGAARHQEAPGMRVLRLRLLSPLCPGRSRPACMAVASHAGARPGAEQHRRG